MANQGVAPPNFSTNVGKTRALLGDTDAENIVGGIGEYAWFSDDEIEAFLDLYSDSPRRAAARLLMTVAGSQALLLKKWTADDLAVDGTAIAESLRRLATQLTNEENTADNNTDFFEISYPGADAECDCVAEGSAWPSSCSYYPANCLRGCY